MSGKYSGAEVGREGYYLDLVTPSKTPRRTKRANLNKASFGSHSDVAQVSMTAFVRAVDARFRLVPPVP